MSTPTLSEVLTRAARFGFEQEGWHPALEQALDGVSAAQATWKPSPERNSIHEIVRHLIHWKKALLDDARPLSSREAFRAYSAQDWQAVPEDADWSQDVAELMRVSRALVEMMTGSSDEALLSPPEGGRTPRLWNLLNAATHDAYHAGQISYLRRLQGA